MNWTDLIKMAIACACGGFVGTQVGHMLAYHRFNMSGPNKSEGQDR